MRDIKLGNDHDLVFEGFDLVVIDGVEALKQRIKRQLLFVQGEWFLDEEAGTPYYPVLSSKDTEAIASVIKNSVKSVDGVKDIITFDSELDEATRKFKVSFEVSHNLDDSNTTITDTIEIG